MRKFLGFFLVIIAFPTIAFANAWQSSYQYAATESYAPQTQRHIIAAADVEASIREALILRGIADSLNVTMRTPNNPVLYSAKTPLRVAIHSLKLNDSAKGWQAQAYILSANRTLSVIPVSGRFERMAHVPVLRNYIAEGDIIRESDITMRELAESQIRRGTVKSKSALIGKAPRRGISADRPIRISEVAAPRLVKKGNSITMHFTTPYMTIRGTGKALEHGSMGDVIRVRNMEGERDVVARITGHNTVEVNMTADVQVADSQY